MLRHIQFQNSPLLPCIFAPECLKTADYLAVWKDENQFNDNSSREQLLAMTMEKEQAEDEKGKLGKKKVKLMVFLWMILSRRVIRE